MKTTLDQSVDLFLGWKLPANFAPDCGISFKRESDYDHPEYGRTKFEPIGTNILTADQAKAMLEHVCEPMLTALQERDAEIERLKYTVKRRDVGIEICATLSVKMEAKLAAQRKVLEQVLNTLIDVTASINMKRFWRDKDGKRFDEITDTAITAIQGVLK